MTKKLTIIGIDPDSRAHGVAVFVDGNLYTLESQTTPQLIQQSKREAGQYPVLFSMENVLKQNFVYSRNAKQSKAAHAKVALSVGRCQQAQFELMQWLDYLELPYVLHPPQTGNWAKNKKLFEKATGWTGRSNADTRSAAYFGFLEARKQ